MSDDIKDLNEELEATDAMTDEDRAQGIDTIIERAREILGK